ncbi:MAG: hypothetical protein AAFO07_12905 [Bacteroidota bacterium]
MTKNTTHKTQTEHKVQSNANAYQSFGPSLESPIYFQDNRPSTIAQRQIQEAANKHKPTPIQFKNQAPVTNSSQVIIQRMKEVDVNGDIGELSADGKAMIINGKLFMLEANANLPQVQMSGNKIGHGASQELGEGSFIKFNIGGTSINYNDNDYVEIIPKFNLTRAFEGESEKAQRNRQTLAAADAGDTRSRYWARTYARNREEYLDDSIFQPLFSTAGNNQAYFGDVIGEPEGSGKDTLEFINLLDQEPHENMLEMISDEDFFKDIEDYSDTTARSSDDDDTPMAGPADCETFSALAMGALKKRARRMCYNKGGKQKLLPEKDDPMAEFSAMSPYRNTVTRNVDGQAVNLQNSPGQALVDEMLYKSIFDFLNAEENRASLSTVHKTIPPNPIHPISQREVNIQRFYKLNENGILTFSDEFGGPSDLSVSQGMQTIKNMYWGMSPELRAKFDKQHGIGQYANPTSGEAYMIATQDDAPGFQDTESGTWSMHWGTVILDLGREKITLEGYAEQGMQENLRTIGILGASEMYQVRNAIFCMYSGINEETGEPYEPDKTFQKRHLDTGTHGNKAITSTFIME